VVSGTGLLSTTPDGVIVFELVPEAVLPLGAGVPPAPPLPPGVKVDVVQDVVVTVRPECDIAVPVPLFIILREPLAGTEGYTVSDVTGKPVPPPVSVLSLQGLVLSVATGGKGGEAVGIGAVGPTLVEWRIGGGMVGIVGPTFVEAEDEAVEQVMLVVEVARTVVVMDSVNVREMVRVGEIGPTKVNEFKSEAEVNPEGRGGAGGEEADARE
jgi:hypothetical protein